MLSWQIQEAEKYIYRFQARVGILNNPWTWARGCRHGAVCLGLLRIGGKKPQRNHKNKFCSLLSFSNVVWLLQKALVVSVKLRKTLYRTASLKKAATPTRDLSPQTHQRNSDHNRTITFLQRRVVTGESVCNVDVPLTHTREMIYSKWQWESISHKGET